jgi:uncharacterized protein (DUF2141 family)
VAITRRIALLIALPAIVLSQPISTRADETRLCAIDVSVDGQRQGTVTIRLFDSQSIGARRFSDLCKGIEGVGYKRSKFDAIYTV